MTLDAATIRTAVSAAMPQTLTDLADLIAIQSVSSLPERAGQVRASAEFVAARLRDAGCPDVRIVAENGQPAVIGRYPAPSGAPTVCLYAHHDVQPTGDAAAWTSPPFEASRRGERLYGRGAADDKGGVAVHLAALRAFDGKPPVGVTVFIEGEEEIGSLSLARLLAAHADILRADVFVITDSVNAGVGAPAFTTTLRGLADCVVEVSTLASGLHSGQFGGVVPDALTALCRLLATLHDDRGNVAVEGLRVAEPPTVDYPLDRLQAETGKLDGVAFIGDGTVAERIWAKPAISVLGIDTTPVALASNTLIPSARAKVSLRVAPGDDAGSALAALVRHLESHAPWGARVTVSQAECGQPGVIPFEGPICEAAAAAIQDAWGKPAEFVGCGGSIPMIAEFQHAFPGAVVLVTAVTDPDSRMHGIDESVHLGDLEKAAVAEAGLLSRLAAL